MDRKPSGCSRYAFTKRKKRTERRGFELKAILCYGDSNTYGYNAQTGRRYPRGARFPGVLQNTLGPEYYVIEEGLGGRTTCLDDPLFEGRSGLAYLRPCLASHTPLALVIVMLGTNDVKERFHIDAFCIGLGMRRLIEAIQDPLAHNGEPVPHMLIVVPAPVLRPVDGKLCEGFGEHSIAVSHALASTYRDVAGNYSCAFFDAASVAEVDNDGVHLTARAHGALGRALAAEARRILA